MMKVVDKIFPCDEKIKSILEANKRARDELILEMRKTTNMTLDAIKDVAGDIKGF